MSEVTGEQTAQHASGRRLLGATAVMASGTLISRALGFVKAVLITVALGNTTRQVDAYNLATVIPNNLYMIFAGGALNTVLVPQIVRHIRQDADDGEAFINRIMTAFLIALGIVGLIAVALAPQVMGLYAPGWRVPALAAHWDQLILMAYITMPQLFFFGVFFLVGQVLNARDKFGPMMWAPIVNNLVQIVVLGAYVAVWGTHGNKSAPFTDEQVWLLAGGSTLGIVLQTAALVPAVRAIGFRYRPRFDLKGQGLGATFHLAKWMLGYVLLTQLVSLLITQLATNATAGGRGAGYSTYNTAYLVWILPHSLLTVSLATAMLPSASRLAAVADLGGVAAETARTLRLAHTFILPASVGLLVLAYPFSMLVFGNGAAQDDWQAVGLTLACFAVGLVPYTIQYVCLRGYYALEDTRTPFLLQVVISAVNAAGAFGLVALDHNPATVAPRLAIAYALSYLVGASITWRALKKRLPDLDGGDILRQLGRLLLAVLPGALVAAAITWYCLGSGSRLMVGAGFAASVLAAAALFLLVARRLGIPEAAQVTTLLRRRGRFGDAGAGTDGTPVGNDVEPEGGFPADAAGTAAAAPLLSYPVPGEHGRDEDGDDGDGDADSHVRPGEVLNDRYRLDQVLNRRGGTQTWLGFDLLLSRPVLLHVLAPGEPRTLEILDEARKAAPATDSRFLRVLDAVLVEGAPHGSYIVCEYAPGQSLELALRQGPLSEVEAAWVVRELADGLVGMHAQGLYHRQLNPDTVVITASGNVKIVGFLVEAALRPEAGDADMPGEAQDVEGLGKLLYAALVARWPGATSYGLLEAPTDSRGRLLLPRQVRAGFSPAINDIVDRILRPTPANRSRRLTTALDVGQALSRVLGGLDASHELNRRLRYPVPPLRFGQAQASPLISEGGGTRATHGVSRPVDGDPGEERDRDSDEDANFHEDRDSDEDANLHEDRDSGEDDDSDEGNDNSDEDDAEMTDAPTESIDVDPGEESTAPFTPLPPTSPAHGREPSRREPTVEPSRAITKVLLVLFALVLLLSLIGVFVNQFNRSRTPAGPVETYRPVAVRDFDPSADGGDDRENPEQAANAIDGEAGTAWLTERYGRSPDFNGRKPGVGLIVDLGEAREVAWVRLNVGAGPTTADIRVPASPDEAPSMRTRDDWRPLKEVPASSGDFTVTLDRPVSTRFVMVYLTRLPAAATGTAFQGRIAELGVGR